MSILEWTWISKLLENIAMFFLKSRTEKYKGDAAKAKAVLDKGRHEREAEKREIENLSNEIFHQQKDECLKAEPELGHPSVPPSLEELEEIYPNEDISALQEAAKKLSKWYENKRNSF